MTNDCPAANSQGRDNQALDNQRRDDQARDDQARDDRARDQQARDSQARDTQARDSQARDKQARDKQARDSQARDTEARDSQPRDKRARDNRARGDQHSPVYPVDVNDVDLRHVARSPTEPVATSYASQRYRLTVDGAQYELTPSAEPTGMTLDRLSVHLIGAWQPDARAATLSENLRRTDNLRHELTDLGQPIRTVGVVAEDGSWFERAIAVGGLDDATATELGATFGQAAVMRIASGEVTVLPTGLRDDIERSTSPYAATVVPFSCPLRPAGSMDRCAQVGGPYGGRAIATAVMWDEYRRVGLHVLGCDTCNDGREPIGGPPGHGISLAPIEVGSRFGGFRWRATSE